MKTYCIFQIYDYKGGELSSSVNLKHEDFISELTIIFEGHIDIDFLEDKSLSDDKKLKKIKKELKDALADEDFFSIYGGGDGFCGKIYVNENDKLKEIKISSYLNDIADYILKQWK